MGGIARAGPAGSRNRDASLDGGGSTAVPDAERRFAEYLEEDRRRGFDPRVAPLARCVLFKFGETEWRLLWTFHHMLADGSVYPALIREAFDGYKAIRDGRKKELAEPRPFREFIEWQLEHGRRPGAEQYWREKLRGFSGATALPEGGPAGGDASYGEQAAAVAVNAPEGVAMTTLVQAAWGMVLGRNAGEEDVVFGATRACRKGTVPDAESVVGLFINTLPVRVRLEGAAKVRDWLRELERERRGMREFEHTPLVEVQAWSELPPGSALFESIVVFTPRLIGAALRELGGEWLTREIEFHERTNFPLTLFAYNEAELVLKLAYDRSRFSDAAIERLLDQMKTALRSLAAYGPRRGQALGEAAALLGSRAAAAAAGVESNNGCEYAPAG